jgi:NADPH-dependent ferric siderophore reductase
VADEPRRKARKAREAEVLSTEWITPRMVRLVVGGPGLAGMECGAFTDHYVKVLFPPEGVTYPEPFDIERIRSEFPREQWPAMRSYTVRAWDSEALRMTLDFVVHGDEGIGGPWAARAEPGDTVRFMGPGGLYAPDASAGWHLLAGDESALPAIAATMERAPADVPVHAFVEVSDAADEQEIRCPEGRGVTWLHRGDRPVGEALVDAVRGLDFPAGEVHAFVHGEAGFVKELRRHLRHDRKVPRERLWISGYWRHGHTDEAWRAVKRAWLDEVEREQEGSGVA